MAVKPGKTPQAPAIPPPRSALPQRSSTVRLDLNNPEFQKDLFNLPKSDFIQAGATLRKIAQQTWQQVYLDPGLKWEKIWSIKLPAGIEAIYSLRLSQHRRALAYREGDFMRLLTIPSDHDTTYGKK